MASATNRMSGSATTNAIVPSTRSRGRFHHSAESVQSPGLTRGCATCMRVICSPPPVSSCTPLGRSRHHLRLAGAVAPDERSPRTAQRFDRLGSGSLSPPACDLAGQRVPAVLVATQLLEERRVHATVAVLSQVIRVRVEQRHPAEPAKVGRLLKPEPRLLLSEDVDQ